MLEVVLAVVVLALIAERVWKDRLTRAHELSLLAQFASERQSLLNRLEARGPGEFAALERATNPKPVPEVEPREHLVGL